MSDEETFRRLIDQVVLDELPAQKWEKLRKHLQGCIGCRARYNKAVLAERMLHGGPHAAAMPSSAEFERIASAGLDPPVASEPAFALGRLLQWFAPTQRWATGLVAAAAAIALIPILTHLNTTQPVVEETFQPRGGPKKDEPVELYASHPELKPTERTAGLRAFCLSGDKVQALDPKGPTPPRCERAGQLKLAVSNTGKYSKLFLVGMDAEHDLKWYAPRPQGAQGVKMAGESVAAPMVGPDGEQLVDIPVGPSVRLIVNHQPGPVRIYALFSDTVIKSSEVEAAREDLAKRGVKTTSTEAETLPLRRSDVLQRSLLIDVGM